MTTGKIISNAIGHGAETRTSRAPPTANLTKRYFETREGPEYNLTIAVGDDPLHVVYSSDPRSQIPDRASAERTPLAAIFSAGENIHDGIVEGRSKLKFYGSIITSQARQLTDLVDHILLFASIRNGKNQYVLRPLHISEILQRVRKNTAALIEAESCSLEERVAPGLPCVWGDIGVVCGCLQNLITNAVKYSGKDRWIGLSASFQNDTHNDKREIRISVQDHGIGISSSELPRIFEPFYRSPQIVAAQIHGTGLGLSLARRLGRQWGEEFR